MIERLIGKTFYVFRYQSLRKRGRLGAQRRKIDCVHSLTFKRYKVAKPKQGIELKAKNTNS